MPCSIAMACKLAIFEYVNEENALGIAETIHILNVNEDLLNNQNWDFDLEVRVKSKTKQGKTLISAATVVRFGDDRKQLAEKLDRLIEGEELEDIIRNQDVLGRGKRKPVAKKSIFMCSSDEENEVPVKHVAKKAKVKSSEMQSDIDLLAALKEKTMGASNIPITAYKKNKSLKDLLDNCPDDRTVSLLQREVFTLREMVENFRTSNTSLLNAVNRLEETNSSLVTTVASLSDLPSIVEKLKELVRKPRTTAPKTSHPPAQPTAIERDEEPADPQSQNTPAPTDNVHGSSYNTAEFSISLDLLKRAIKTDARKMTNDLMHGLYSEEFMASHSVSGVGNGGKPAMPQSAVSAIISAVLGQFGDTVRTTDVRFYMREKLNNATKVQRRKQKK